MKAAGGGAKFTHRRGIALGRYRDIVASRSTVDIGGVGLDTVEQARIYGAVFGSGGLREAVGRLFFRRASPLIELVEVRAQGCDGTSTLLNRITAGVSPMTFLRHPIAMLRNGLKHQSEGN
jgi:hypothetical protein